ncbi:transport permease protein [Planctomycetota bacterium]|nr:transport permease protein [Planctomycetota bacterium]
MSASIDPLERSYSAEDADQGVLQHLLPVLGFPKTIWEHRYLVQNFFRRELLGRFRGSVLGLLWVLIHPMFLFAIYYFVFGYLFGRPGTGTAPSPEYALYMFSGVIVFASLTEGLGRACTCITDNGNLVKKVAFPSELLPVPVILVAMVVYLVGALVCVGVGLWFGLLTPGLELLLLPVVLVLQFMLSLGLGLLLANGNVFARDTSQLWSIIASAWMFLTPVFWVPKQLIENVPWLEQMLAFNPAYPLVQAHRLCLGAHPSTLNGVAVDYGNLSDHLLNAAVWAVLFLVVGYAVFTSRKHKYADLV